MPPRRRMNESPPAPRRRATTPEGRENELIAAAVDLAESQIRGGTASSQVITHFLKLGSTREKLEQERLAGENALLAAKAEAMAASQRIEALFSEALDAMRSYKGEETQTYDDRFDD